MKSYYVFLVCVLCSLTICANNLLPYQCISGSNEEFILSFDEKSNTFIAASSSEDDFFSGSVITEGVFNIFYKLKINGNGLLTKENNVILNQFFSNQDSAIYSLYGQNVLQLVNNKYLYTKLRTNETENGTLIEVLLSIYDNQFNLIKEDIVMNSFLDFYCGLSINNCKIIEYDGRYFVNLSLKNNGGLVCGLDPYSAISVVDTNGNRVEPSPDFNFINNYFIGGESIIIPTSTNKFVLSYEEFSYEKVDLSVGISVFNQNDSLLFYTPLYTKFAYRNYINSNQLIDDKIIVVGGINTENTYGLISQSFFRSFDINTFEYKELNFDTLGFEYIVFELENLNLNYILIEKNLQTNVQSYYHLILDRDLNILSKQLISSNQNVRQIGNYDNDYVYINYSDTLLDLNSYSLNTHQVNWVTSLPLTVEYDGNTYNYSIYGIINNFHTNSVYEDRKYFYIVYGYNEKEIFGIYYFDTKLGTTNFVGIVTSFDWVYVYDNITDIFVLHNSFETVCSQLADIQLLKLQIQKNTLTLAAFVDNNSNGIKDANEPFYTDGSVKVRKNLAFINQIALHNQGYATTIIDTGIYNLELQFSSNLFSTLDINKEVNNSDYNHNDTIYWALTPNGIIHDIAVSLNNLGISRPGFETTYLLSILNKGNQYIQNASAKLLLDNNLTILDISTAYSQSGDTLFFNNINLQPSEKLLISIQLRVSTDLTFGHSLQSKASVFNSNSEINYVNNNIIFTDIVRGSFDPNDKTSNITTINPIDLKNQLITYTIRFENVGNDTAFNIIIRDTIHDNFDMSSIQIISTSHNYTLSIIEDSILVFYYPNILLPPTQQDSVASHGYVVYAIQPDSITNSDLKNTAHITFDYNKPVATNTALTRLEETTAIKTDIANSNAIIVYPNPANQLTQIDLSKIKLNNAVLSLYNLDGKKIHTKRVSSNNILIDVATIPSGTYYIVINDGESIYSKQLLIQH